MELKKGMYVRTEKGKIDKIIGFDGALILFLYDFVYGYIDENDIIKASNNIIDLIEEGDYVNGSLVDQIDNYSNGYICVNVDRNSNMGFREISFKNEDIKSIVTKEQFESISYKVN